MISYIKGTVFYLGGDYAIILVSDIGYKVYLNTEVISALNQGIIIELFTYQNVKEDTLDLFGFQTIKELDFFEKLISISGIGPKSALGILAAASINDLESAIVRGDASILTKVSGIGTKTADRVVLELKGKISNFDASLSSSATSEDVEVIEALENLGYSSNEAREALKQLDVSAKGVDEKLKGALKLLGR